MYAIIDIPTCSTGKERDSESGNDYFEARCYASSMGRFLSPDWSAKMEPVPYAKLDSPQTLNLYAYVGNNPLRFVDADGHEVDLNGTAASLLRSPSCRVKGRRSKVSLVRDTIPSLMKPNGISENSRAEVVIGNAIGKRGSGDRYKIIYTCVAVKSRCVA